jgi:hypothetical protein
VLFGALRLDPEAFRSAVSPEVRTRLHLAVVILAAISFGFATAMGAVAVGVLGEHEVAFYRAVVMSWAIALVVHFLLFVGIVWLLRKLMRSPHVALAALTRLLAMSLAPYALGVLVAWAGYTPGDLAMQWLAANLGQSWFVLLGALLGYYPDDLALALGFWSYAIAIAGLHFGARTSWAGAAAVVLVAARLVGPLPELADLVMNGV